NYLSAQGQYYRQDARARNAPGGAISRRERLSRSKLRSGSDILVYSEEVQWIILLFYFDQTLEIGTVGGCHPIRLIIRHEINVGCASSIRFRFFEKAASPVDASPIHADLAPASVNVHDIVRASLREGSCIYCYATSGTSHMSDKHLAFRSR